VETNKNTHILIQQYLEGELDEKAMHELEKQALDDPFLADAIEGYSATDVPAGTSLSFLQRQLAERIAQQQENKNVFYFTWQRISVAAAGCLLFIAASILFWMKSQPKDGNPAVKEKQVDVNLNAFNDQRMDPHSFSLPSQAVVSHLDLDINVDFTSQIISGKAAWTIDNLSKTDTIVFDTRQLDIQKVTLGDGYEQTSFKLGEETPFLGKSLKVAIKPSTRKVTIWYKTGKAADALQWLNPAQTAGKRYPFLFTQSQAILARTWIPCQDSPGIRFTYNATVSVPPALMALMSAENPEKRSEDGKYHFKQPYAIPSYLMALAVGDIRFKPIDRRTGVYAEPVTLDKAAWEFADMGKMVGAAEKLYGPYQWERYDVLVLPPSFPFGGMENPMLTFATPTVIAGDRSLVSLIAHELAHSWSGNLVTNVTWNDFWLNEGFTTYFERRIVEAVYGKQEAEMQEMLGFDLLKEAVTEIGANNQDTELKGHYEGRDPDEGVSDIPYEKGYAFLKVIEKEVGRARFDAFLKEYFNNHKFRSVSTDEFISYLEEHLAGKEPGLKDKIKLSEWIFKPGIPGNAVQPVSARFNAIDNIVSSWKGKINPAGLKGKITSANELLYFIKALPDNTTSADMALIDKEFGFTSSGNSELQFAWYLLAIRKQYKPAYPRIEEFLIAVGRRKFILPLYQEMVKTGAGKIWAEKIYKKARPNYHPVTFRSVDDLFNKEV